MAKIVTITNPLTGQAAQVDQLDHTAQQIDDGLNIARGVSNPNILDDWYFGNPVDQRQGRVVKPNTTYYSDNQLATSAGTTSAYVTAYRYATGTASGVSYASFKLKDSDTAPTYYAAPENVVRGYTGAGYGIDRWTLDVDAGGGIIITDNGIVITSSGTYWGTRIDKLSLYAGKTVTGSALMTDGTLHRGTIDSVNWQINVSQTIFSNNDIHMYINKIGDDLAQIEISSNRAGVGIKAIKLELGTQQTLAHQDISGNWVLNEIPDYGEQLRRCQYYSRFFGEDIEIPYSNNEAGSYMEGTLPLTMRSGGGAISFANGYLFTGNGTYYQVTSASVTSNGGRVKIGVNVNGQLTANQQATLHLTNCSISFDL